MKYNPKHFKFKTTYSRVKLSVWKKYYALKAKKPSELTEYDKFYIRQLRVILKEPKMILRGNHIPSQVETKWTIKKDLTKEKFNKKEYFSKLLMKVKDKRQALTMPKVETKYFEGANYRTIGGVMEKANTINPLGQFLTTNNPLAAKVPRHKNKNYIGIELEFNALPAGPNQAQIAQKLKDAGLAKYVDVTTDASCGWEVRVLLLEDEFEPALKQILSVICGMGFKVSQDCGTHVHFDMRNRDVKVVYSNLFKAQKFLRKFITYNRKHKNQYCKVNKADTFDKQLSLGDRRHSINVEAYREHRTIEIRMHQGTLDVSELVPWIKLLIKIANYQTSVDNSVNTLKQAKKQFDFDEPLVHNLEERIRKVYSRAKVAAPDIAPGAPPQGQATLRNWLGI